MTNQEYAVKAMRTYGNGLEGGMIRLMNQSSHMTTLVGVRILQFAHIGRHADRLKRFLFYGNMSHASGVDGIFEPVESLPQGFDFDVSLRDTEVITKKLANIEHIDAIHAIIGIVGEVGEIADWYLKYLFGRITREEFILQCRKEVGDILWYINLLAVKVLQVNSLSEIMAENIAKLEARYPDKFNVEDAVARKDESQ